MPGPGGGLDIGEMASSMADGLLVLGPTGDGDVLPESAEAAMAGGVGGDLPLVVGATSEEFTMISRMQPTEPEVTRAALGRLGLRADAVDAYIASHGGAALGQALTDRMFRSGGIALAERRSVGPAPTYHYDFRWKSPFMDGLLGACHCIDLPFAFDTIDAPGTEALLEGAPRDLVTAVHDAWVSFVHTGDPGWPAYDVAGRQTMVFDEVSAVTSDALAFERQAWSNGEGQAEGAEHRRASAGDRLGCRTPSGVRLGAWMCPRFASPTRVA